MFYGFPRSPVHSGDLGSGALSLTDQTWALHTLKPWAVCWDTTIAAHTHTHYLLRAPRAFRAASQTVFTCGDEGRQASVICWTQRQRHLHMNEREFRSSAGLCVQHRPHQDRTAQCLERNGLRQKNKSQHWMSTSIRILIARSENEHLGKIVDINVHNQPS